MRPAFATWLSANVRHLPTFLITLALLALLVWGHASDWKLPGGKGDADDDEDKGAVAKDEKDTGRVLVMPDPTVPLSTDDTVRPSHLIEFPSEDAVTKTGLVPVPVEVRTVVEEVVATGVLAFDQARFAKLASRAAGSVWAVLRRAGEQVQAGEALVLVDSVEVAKAKADLVQSLVQFDLKRQVLERMRTGDGSVPDRQLREAEAAYREGRVRLLQDRQALANLGLPVRLEDFAGQTDEQVFHRLRVLGLPEHYRKEVASAAGSAGLLPLVAPFAGEVIRCSAVRGEIAGTSQPLFVIAATSPLWVLLDVRLEDVSKLRLGQSVKFLPDAGDKPAPISAALTFPLGYFLSMASEPAIGTLDWVSAEADPKTRTVRARASLANPFRRLRPNTFGTCRIVICARLNAVVVPGEAVQRDGQANFVFVQLRPTVFQSRHVVLGQRIGSDVEILRGLLPEEIVVTTGSHVLKSELRKDLIVETD